jgi:hypothetical protein
LPLRAELRIKSDGATSTQKFVRKLNDVAKAFHDAWEKVQLPDSLPSYAPSSHFFTWNDEGVDEATGAPMAYSGLLSAKDAEKPQLGFVMMRMIHRLGGFSRFSMDHIFYQVQPVREIILESHNERDM